jgi:hypothetical protein
VTKDSVSRAFEFAGREKKAAAIAQLMRVDHVPVGRLELYERWMYDASSPNASQGSIEYWMKYARAAGYKRKTPPSTECRRMVIAMLKGTK